MELAARTLICRVRGRISLLPMLRHLSTMGLALSKSKQAWQFSAILSIVSTQWRLEISLEHSMAWAISFSSQDLKNYLNASQRQYEDSYSFLFLQNTPMSICTLANSFECFMPRRYQVAFLPLLTNQSQLPKQYAASMLHRMFFFTKESMQLQVNCMLSSTSRYQIGIGCCLLFKIQLTAPALYAASFLIIKALTSPLLGRRGLGVHSMSYRALTRVIANEKISQSQELRVEETRFQRISARQAEDLKIGTPLIVFPPIVASEKPARRQAFFWAEQQKLEPRRSLWRTPAVCTLKRAQVVWKQISSNSFQTQQKFLLKALQIPISSREASKGSKIITMHLVCFIYSFIRTYHSFMKQSYRDTMQGHCRAFSFLRMKIQRRAFLKFIQLELLKGMSLIEY